LQDVSRKIAVLGDMMELGIFFLMLIRDWHTGRSSCEILVTVGVRSRKIAELLKMLA